MLVLSRKPGERIVIEAAGGIVVTLVTSGRAQVRIGIDAPRNVNVYRAELADDFRRARPGPGTGVGHPERPRGTG